MDFTEKIIYTNGAGKTPIDAYRLQIDLGPNDERVPYISVEILTGNLRTTLLAIDTFTLKVDEGAMNYYSDDRKGTTLGVLTFNSVIGADHCFTTNGSVSPKVVFGGQTRFLTIYLENGEGIKQPLASIDPFSLLIKATYPRVNSIEEAYRTQVPLPSRV